MLKSIKLFNIFGVDIKAHWSWAFMFILLINFSDPIGDMLLDALTVVMIFTFVLIHEFGHIFAARKYGVGCSKVVLSFLGGAAIVDESMEQLEPKKALWVAFAGPLTNLIMFILLIPFSSMVLGSGDITVETLTSGQMMYLMAVIVNVMMFVFNLLPIYPMDGGRLLRSTLELFNVRHSLIISIRVTQLFCLGLIVLGFIIGSWTMPIIGALFFLTSFFELRKMKQDEELSELMNIVTSDVRRKIIWAFESRSMTNEEKNEFLDALESAALESGENHIINHVKSITDEFRQDIARA